HRRSENSRRAEAGVGIFAHEREMIGQHQLETTADEPAVALEVEGRHAELRAFVSGHQIRHVAVLEVADAGADLPGFIRLDQAATRVHWKFHAAERADNNTIEPQIAADAARDRP